MAPSSVTCDLAVSDPSLVSRFSPGAVLLSRGEVLRVRVEQCGQGGTAFALYLPFPSPLLPRPGKPMRSAGGIRAVLDG